MQSKTREKQQRGLNSKHFLHLSFPFSPTHFFLFVAFSRFLGFEHNAARGVGFIAEARRVRRRRVRARVHRRLRDAATNEVVVRRRRRRHLLLLLSNNRRLRADLVVAVSKHASVHEGALLSHQKVAAHLRLELGVVDELAALLLLQIKAGRGVLGVALLLVLEHAAVRLRLVVEHRHVVLRATIVQRQGNGSVRVHRAGRKHRCCCCWR